MKRIDLIISKAALIDKTIIGNKLIGLRVIAKNGAIIGRVKQLRLNLSATEVEGFIVGKGIKKPMYIGREYINNISNSALILNIFPNNLLKGRNVIDPEGKKLGIVKTVNRRGNTNVLQNLIVGSFLKKNLTIPASAIKTIGRSIVLQDNYNAKQKYIWQKT